SPPARLRALSPSKKPRTPLLCWGLTMSSYEGPERDPRALSGPASLGLSKVRGARGRPYVGAPERAPPPAERDEVLLDEAQLAHADGDRARSKLPWSPHGAAPRSDWTEEEQAEIEKLFTDALEGKLPRRRGA